MKIINWFKSKIEYLNSVESICKKYGIENYTINEDGTVDVDGGVDLSEKGLTKLPLKFGKVTGYFDCSNNQLKTLKGGPNYVGDAYFCSNNQLKTLEGSPNWVGKYFRCSNNQLKTLKGGPNYVGDAYFCSNNQLITLEGGPETVLGNYYCNDNQLKTLNGCPDYVGGYFICDYMDNEYVTIHEVYCLFDHKSFIKQYKREQKLKELLEN